MATQPKAGPSTQKARNSKKPTKNVVKSSKLKKLSEKQKIEALERNAMEYVSTAILYRFLLCLIT